MRWRYGVAAVVVLAAALAGCVDDGNGDGDDGLPAGTGPKIRSGDLIKVQLIGRFASNGTPFMSTVDGSLPDDAGIVDVADRRHDDRWVLVHHPPDPDGPTEDALAKVNFLDLDDDGRHESTFLVHADYVRRGGNLVPINETPTLSDTPDNVTTKPIEPEASGLLDAYLDTRVGGFGEITLPPAEAYGSHDSSKVHERPLLVPHQLRDLNLTRSVAERRTNFTNQTEAGDVVALQTIGNATIDARVRNVNATHVRIYLLVEDGQTFRLPRRSWDGTVVNVTEHHYEIRQSPSVGDRTPDGRVVEVGEDTYVVDGNHPAAGERVTFQYHVVERIQVNASRYHRADPVQPVEKGEPPNDVAIANTANVIQATDRGLFYSFARNQTALFGASWFPVYDGLEDRTVHAIEVARDDARTFFVGVDDGLLYSTDYGETWTDRSDGLPGGAAVTDVSHAASDPSVAYAFVQGEGLYRSADRGATWSRVNGTWGAAKSLAVDPADPDAVYLVRNGSIHRSMDGGATWTHAGIDPAPDVRDLELVDGRRFVAAANGTSYQSNDAGGSWSGIGGPVDQLSFLYSRPGWTFGFATTGDNRGTGYMRQQFSAGSLWQVIPLR